MTTSFSVEFGDDFTDHIRELAEEAVGNMDMTDAITNALGGYADPNDHYDMSYYVRQDEMDNYVTKDDLPDEPDFTREEMETMARQVAEMRQVLVTLVTALAKAGIVPVTQDTPPMA